MAKKTTAVATKADAQLPAGSAEFGEMEGLGMENAGAEDIIVPRLTIVQSMSPQLKRSKPEYIEGAQEGNIVDVATSDLWEEKIIFLPVMFRKDWLEWAPRDSGKGLQNIHPTADILAQCEADAKGKQFLPNGNQVIETAQWYGLNMSEGAARRKSFIPMASSQLKSSRKWMTMAQGEKLARADGTEYTPPLFYRLYELGTADASNNDGDWKVWTVDRLPALPEEEAANYFSIPYKELLKEAMEFYRMLSDGEARADLSAMRDEATGGGSADQDGAM
jgi:hypothetical protein